jgi:hypothetical protein
LLRKKEERSARFSIEEIDPANPINPACIPCSRGFCLDVQPGCLISLIISKFLSEYEHRARSPPPPPPPPTRYLCLHGQVLVACALSYYYETRLRRRQERSAGGGEYVRARSFKCVSAVIYAGVHT